MNRKSISDISGLHMSRNIPIAESTHISSADETSLIKNSPVRLVAGFSSNFINKIKYDVIGFVFFL